MKLLSVSLLLAVLPLTVLALAPVYDKEPVTACKCARIDCPDEPIAVCTELDDPILSTMIFPLALLTSEM